MEHTATPWEEEDIGALYRANGVLCLEVGKERPRADKARGNAVLFPKAVNSHDALVECAKRLAACEHEDHGRSAPSKEDCAFARAALKLAEQEALMTSMEMRYIGACSLLARLYSKLPSHDTESKESIELALADFQEELPGRFDVRPNGNGIWFEPKR